MTNNSVQLPTVNDKPTCGNCRYFQPNARNLNEGECHYERPKLVVMPGKLAFYWCNLKRDDVACKDYEELVGDDSK